MKQVYKDALYVLFLHQFQEYGLTEEELISLLYSNEDYMDDWIFRHYMSMRMQNES